MPGFWSVFDDVFGRNDIQDLRRDIMASLQDVKLVVARLAEVVMAERAEVAEMKAGLKAEVERLAEVVRQFGSPKELDEVLQALIDIEAGIKGIEEKPALPEVVAEVEAEVVAEAEVVVEDFVVAVEKVSFPPLIEEDLLDEMTLDDELDLDEDM